MGAPATEASRSALWRAAAIVVGCGAVTGALRITPVFDPDYHWHLHTGRWIAVHRAVPAVDPFSHTFAGQPWKFVDWLSDLILYGLHRAGGDALVIVAFALAGGVAVAWALETARGATPTATSEGLLVVGLLVGAAVVFRVTPRPQTLTLLLFAAELAILERARTAGRALWLIPPLLVLWQNLHGSAQLGWLALLAFAVGQTLDARMGRAPIAGSSGSSAPPPRLFIVTAVSLASIFVAVRPWSRFLAAFDHVGDPRVAVLFTEWAPIHTLRGFNGAVVALLLLLVLALSALSPQGRKEIPLDRVLLAAGMVLLAERTLRLVPFAALALAPLALHGFARLAGGRVAVRAALAALGVSAAVGLFVAQRKPPGVGLDRPQFPEGSAAFLSRVHPAGPMYNEFQFGGYLMWTLRDAYPVFIDGRSMALYGIDFTYQVLSADEQKIGPLLARYDVGFVVAPSGKRIDWFQRKPGWTIAYFDDVSFVAIRDSAQPAAVRALGYRTIHPASYWEDVIGLAQDPVRLPLAIAEAERAIREAPDSSMPHVARAAVAMAAGDGARADAEIELAIRLHPEAIRGHRIKTMRCVERHDRACACREAGIVVQLAPTNAYARNVRLVLACEGPP